MRFRHTIWMAAGFSGLLAAGCAGPEPADTDVMGMARVGLITPRIFPYELTRVAVETDTGFSVDLVTDPVAGLSTGTLLLPAGVHELTARAFVQGEQVGLSSPVPADIQAGAVTQVTIQLLDTTGGRQPDFGPLLASLSHPTSTHAGAEVMFAVSIIDPDGTPVSLEWSDDCGDSDFTAPQSATTGWFKATPGACRVTVTGSSNGLEISQSFQISVFVAGADQGGADVLAEFISAPSPVLQIIVPEASCAVEPFGFDATCRVPVASPTVARLEAFVSWENGTRGAVTLSDDCGGSLAVSYQDEFFTSASWLPPVAGGLCRITAHAVNQEGVVGAIAMAVLVAPGTPREPAGEPVVALDLSSPFSYCSGRSDQGETACEPVAAGLVADVFGNLQWADTTPARIELADSCGGSFDGTYIDLVNGFFSTRWQPPAEPVTDCTITATATSLEGVSRAAVLRFDVVLPPEL